MRFVLALIVVLLSGCTTFDPVVKYAAKANDNALMSAEFTICNAASVGSVMRRYNTEELAALWRDLCLKRSDFGLQE